MQSTSPQRKSVGHRNWRRGSAARDHGIIDSTGKTQKLTYTWSDKLLSTRKFCSCKCAICEKSNVAIACRCKSRCDHLAGGTVTPLAAPPLSEPNLTPTTSGKDGASDDDTRSDTLLLKVENEDCTLIQFEGIGWMVGRYVIDGAQYRTHRPWRVIRRRCMSVRMKTAGVGSFRRISLC